VNRILAPFRALAASGLVLGLAACAGPNDWPNYRYVQFRDANQPTASALSDPARVPTLAVRWTFPAVGSAGAFKASPIVVNGTVFIGSTSGYFYAIDAATGSLKWQYPAAGAPGLIPSNTTYRYGIASSAAYWYRWKWFVRKWFHWKERDVVIFGAQDPSLGPDGSARLFALYADDGSLFWKSDPVATVNGTTSGSTTELHQTIRYSAPLIFNDYVYVGIADSGDSPIQQGRVVAVDLNTGHLVPGFSFAATGTRGGGVWNAPAADLESVFFTTGNTRCDAAGCQSPEPSPNHGLSMIRVDRGSGAITWEFQPVAYNNDDDPDWSAGAAVAFASCGERIVSVQKDGWAYALGAGTTTPSAPAVNWQFPPTGYPFNGPDMGVHGDFHYKRAPAIWNDVAILTAGGESRMNDGPASGYGKLHAINICATSEAGRVRWLLDVPHNGGGGYSLGAPTVTGGIAYVGTDMGHVIAIADPSVNPSVGTRCSNVDYTTSAACAAAHFVLVPIPAVLADVAVPDNSSLVGLRNEPALAGGRVFVSSGGGHVYMLSP
jgi:outer membrane protein assembly factor BamB